MFLEVLSRVNLENTRDGKKTNVRKWKRTRGEKGKQLELIIRRAKEDLSGVSIRCARDSPTLALLLFIPAALSGRPPGRVGVSSWRLNIITIIRNSHAATLPRTRAKPRARTVDARRVKRDKEPNGSRQVRGEVVCTEVRWKKGSRMKKKCRRMTVVVRWRKPRTAP